MNIKITLYIIGLLSVSLGYLKNDLKLAVAGLLLINIAK